MAETIDKLTLLQQLEQSRKDKIDELAALIDNREQARGEFEKREQAESEDAKPSEEQRAAHIVAEEEYQAEVDKRDAELKHLDKRVSEQEILERRRQEAAKASMGDLRVTSEPLTYRKDNARQISYFRDLAARYHSTFASRYDDVQGAVERLDQHAVEMRVELPKRQEKRDRLADEQIERAEREFTGSIGLQRRGLNETPFERRVNPNRTDGQGGFVMVAAA